MLVIFFIRFLTNPDDKDLWKWATEGLAYLSLDADIKELIMQNVPAIHSLIEVAKVKCVIKSLDREIK